MIVVPLSACYAIKCTCYTIKRCYAIKYTINYGISTIQVGEPYILVQSYLFYQDWLL